MLLTFAVTYWASSFFAVFAVTLTVVGVVAVRYAITTVVENEKAISDAETRLNTYEDWEGAYQHDQQSLMTWFDNHQIDRESGVADVISACWAAYQSKRAVSLSEIHALASRRERTNLGAKLSGLISAMLLIVGIVGTLLSVHPVLTDFNFGVSGQQTGIVSTADSTAKINDLMNSLGDAFVPSLFALGGTLIVAGFRFLYTRKLNTYAIKLDHFAIWQVIPRFRPLSASDEFATLAQAFNGIADGIRVRDKQHEEMLNALESLVTKTNTTITGLEGTVKRINGAADTLAARSASVGESLIKTLGQPSPLLKVFGEYEKVFERANTHLDKMASSVDELMKSNQRTANKLEKSADKFSDKLNLIVNNNQAGLDQVHKSVGYLEESQEAQKELLKQGLQTLQVHHQSILEETQNSLKGIADERKLEAENQKELLKQGLQTLQAHHQSLLEETQNSLKGIADERKLEAEKVQQNLEAVQQHHFEAKAAVQEAVSGIDEMVKTLPQEAAKSTRDLFLKGLQDVKTEMLSLGRETRDEAKALSTQIKGKFAEIQEGIKSARDLNLSSVESKLQALPTIIDQALRKTLQAQDQYQQQLSAQQIELERAQRAAKGITDSDRAPFWTFPTQTQPFAPPPIPSNSPQASIPVESESEPSKPLGTLPSIIRIESNSTPLMPPPPPPRD